MLGRDGIAGLICLAISIFMLYLSLGLPPALMVPIGPAFYPRVVLGLMAALSLVVIADDLLGRRRQATGEAPPATAARAPTAAPTAAEVAQAVRATTSSVAGGANYRLVLLTFILFGVYVLVLPWLGFRIATFLFVGALQITLEWPRSAWRWVLMLVIAVSTAVVCHFVFENYLSVLLPRGRWTGM